MNETMGHLMPAYMETGGTCVVAAHVLRWKAWNCVSKTRAFNVRTPKIGIKVKLHVKHS